MNARAIPAIEGFFDCSCVWAWLAFEHAGRFAAREGVEICWRPVLATDLFAQVNRGVGWPLAEAKQDYYRKDLPAWADYLGLSLAGDPPGSAEMFAGIAGDMTDCMLACVAAGRWGRLEAFARAAMHAAFAQGRNLGDRTVIADVWNEAGLPLATLAEGLAWPGIAAELAANTRELAERGGFGVPTFFLGDDMFFGNDSIPLLERAFWARRMLA